MYIIFTFFLCVIVLAAMPALAANPIGIEQVGPYSAEISAGRQQFFGEPSLMPSRTADYQDNIINNPLTSQRARVQSIAGQYSDMPDAESAQKNLAGGIP